MFISTLIDTVRQDYTRDNNSDKFAWDDKSLFRKFTEAEKQACNRANLIYDDSNTEYTQITLVSGQASYSLSPKLTVIENIIFDGNVIVKKTKEEIDRLTPTWRTDTTLTGNVIYAIVSGRTIRFNRVPDATDAGKIIYLEVYRLPDVDISYLAQEPEIPEEHHRDLIYWVLHECYKKQDLDAFDKEEPDYNLSRFNQIFGEPVSAKVRQHQLENPKSTLIRPVSYFNKTQTSNFDD